MRLHVLASLVFAVALSACSNGTQTSSSASPSASLTVAGSTALLPLVQRSAEDYMRAQPGLSISVGGGGSGTGLSQLASNQVDIADSDVEVSAMQGAKDHQVAVVAFAIVTGPNTGVKSLTRTQVADIFSGRVHSWKDVGGDVTPIVIINRPLNSGTRKVFSTMFLGGKEPMGTQTEESSEKLAEKVKNTPGAVSYVALSSAQKFNVPTVAIDGVAPSTATITGGKYAFWTYEHMYTNAHSSAQAEDFIAFVQTEHAAIDQLGFISVNDMKMAKR